MWIEMILTKGPLSSEQQKLWFEIDSGTTPERFFKVLRQNRQTGLDFVTREILENFVERPLDEEFVRESLLAKLAELSQSGFDLGEFVSRNFSAQRVRERLELIRGTFARPTQAYTKATPTERIQIDEALMWLDRLCRFHSWKRLARSGAELRVEFVESIKEELDPSSQVTKDHLSFGDLYLTPRGFGRSLMESYREGGFRDPHLMNWLYVGADFAVCLEPEGVHPSAELFSDWKSRQEEHFNHLGIDLKGSGAQFGFCVVGRLNLERSNFGTKDPSEIRQGLSQFPFLFSLRTQMRNQLGSVLPRNNSDQTQIPPLSNPSVV